MGGAFGRWLPSQVRNRLETTDPRGGWLGSGPWGGAQWPQQGWMWGGGKRNPEAVGVSHLGRGWEGPREQVCLEGDMDSMLALV